MFAPGKRLRQARLPAARRRARLLAPSGAPR